MPRASLEGRSYLVTGATDGIGRHTAHRLAREGATVLMHGRSPEKAKQVAEELRKSTGNNNLKPYSADLACMAQIRQLAAQVKQSHGDVDVLINNAGVFSQQYVHTEDGFELTWAVNVLAPFLLTGLLLDSVRERIVNVSSISASNSIDFDNLQQEKGFSSHNSYSNSKLCSMIFTSELGDRIADTGITVNCLDPGTVNTKMLYAGWGPCGMRVEDANYEFDAATNPALARTTGAYYVGGRHRSMPRTATDPQTRARLWAIMEKHTHFRYPYAVT